MSAVRTGGTEFDLLCQATRPQTDLTRVRDLLRGKIDHSFLAALALGHGVQPRLFRCLDHLCWEGVPEAEQHSQQLFRQDHLVRTLMLADELRHVAAAFDERGVAFTAFKGPALAITLYGNLADREYNDLDLLVPEDRVDDAEDVLASLGYHPPQGHRAFRRAFLGHLRQNTFRREGSPTAIDLHWDFSGAHVPFPLRTADVWSDLAHMSIGDRDIATISGANLALLLAGHGTKEAWKLLKWVGDFAWMIDRHRDLDWLDIHRRALAQRCGDALLLGCGMAHELLDIAPPDELAGIVERNDRVLARTALLSGRMRAGILPSLEGENFADLDLCDRRIDRIKGALRLAFTPTPGDYAALKLPPALWGAYYITRPCRLALRAIKGIG